MKTTQDLRLYYNHTIHPELLRLENRRHRLIIFVAFSFLMLLLIFIAQLYFKTLLVTLVLLIPMALCVTLAYNELETFRSNFKPKIVTLLLEFISGEVSHHNPMKYVSNAAIGTDIFDKSRLFVASSIDYTGEDYISGDMGELSFELAELAVKEISPVRNRLDDVFAGVFMHARFTERSVQASTGEILVLPRHLRQFLSRTIKTFTLNGGRLTELNNKEFGDYFVVYSNETANVKGFLSDNMQSALKAYRAKEGKEVYMSVVGDDIFIAVAQDRDLLEPVLWRSNVSFDLISMYYQDLTLLLSILNDIDANN